MAESREDIERKIAGLRSRAASTTFENERESCLNLIIKLEAKLKTTNSDPKASTTHGTRTGRTHHKINFDFEEPDEASFASDEEFQRFAKFFFGDRFSNFHDVYAKAGATNETWQQRKRREEDERRKRIEEERRKRQEFDAKYWTIALADKWRVLRESEFEKQQIYDVRIVFELNELVNHIMWRTRDGRTPLISEIEAGHLRNIIKLMESTPHYNHQNNPVYLVMKAWAVEQGYLSKDLFVMHSYRYLTYTLGLTRYYKVTGKGDGEWQVIQGKSGTVMYMTDRELIELAMSEGMSYFTFDVYGEGSAT